MQKMHEVMRMEKRMIDGNWFRRRLLQQAGAAACALLLPGLARAENPPPAAVRVAAASDLKFALADVATRFRQQTGQSVTVQLGSSGNFARQIRQGLPVDIFMSADEAMANELVAAGLTSDGGVLYAVGRIVAVVPASSGLKLEPDLRSLLEPAVRKIAIANPEHAPYGRAAQQALQRLGLWEPLRSRLVMGENIAQATQFVTTGAAQAGISALSLARAPQLSSQLRHLLLPDDLHAPLRQRMVLLKAASPQALAFYRYLQSPAATGVLEEYGFAVPGRIPAPPKT